MTFQEFQPVLIWIGLYLKLFAFILVRPLFFSLFFMPFSSVLGRAIVIRFVICCSMIFPVFLAFNKEILEVGNRSLLEQWIFIGVEAFIGVIMGMILSIPFWVAKLSGGVVDAYRGELNSEDRDKSGEVLTTTSKLILAMTILVFAINDGFILVYQALYATYTIWPIGDVFIFNAFGNIAGILALADAIFKMTLFVVLPLVILILAVEFSMSFFDSLSQKAKISQQAQLQKSFAYVLLIPIYIYFLAYFAQSEIFEFFKFIDTLKELTE